MSYILNCGGCGNPAGGRATRNFFVFSVFRSLLLSAVTIPFTDRPVGVIWDGTGVLSRKEVFQPHLPVRLPCYDLAPVTTFALDGARTPASGARGSHGLTGGVYKARERIHRAMADARLLANPASRSRVADSDPN